MTKCGILYQQTKIKSRIYHTNAEIILDVMVVIYNLHSNIYLCQNPTEKLNIIDVSNLRAYVH